jgi:hypothetical protein
MSKIKLFFLISLVFLNFGSAFAQKNEVVPILEMRIGGMLGGVENGKWLTVKQTMAKITGMDGYLITDTQGQKSTQLAPTIDSPDAPCEEFYPIRDSTPSDGVAIGNNAKWKSQPRRLQAIDVNDKIYQKVVGDILRKKLIAKPTIKIVQAFRVDLDGDGKEEVVIAATNYKGGLTSASKAGDYSFVLVRKIIGNKVQDIIVSGEFHLKAKTFDAPNQMRLSAIADLNGDGKMEIVIYGEYYEGNWVQAFEMKANKPVKVLETGCGV